MARVRRKFSDEFKQEAVRLVRESDRLWPQWRAIWASTGTACASGNVQKSSMGCKLFRAKGAVTMKS